ncbi:MAG TPA: 3-oxoacyl-ACP reductase family protein [Syntrophomonadaceae bacterium]|nr:3-oxoacyl-ACP reductase FabG [Syntrophomonadaceae bacterium]HNX29589.1 3-oxoacyl-ACP reductase family protein [Syntrophomonadaceae bacterium]HPR94062.1 3-oxoacyl-ACP reductase family protein [Syntrophomonadaceae bacterium]
MQSNLALEGKVCLVTGASRGIGKAITAAAAAQGAMVAVNYCHSAVEARQFTQELQGQGYKAAAFKADISSAQQVDKMFTEIEALWGKVDFLVNNAGISCKALLTDLSEADWYKVMDVNLKGPFLCSKRAMPNMISARFGRIINIASIWGVNGASCESVYAASKGGLIAFTKSLAREAGPSGVLVNAVAPGPVVTDMLNHELDDDERRELTGQIPLNRLGTPEDIAAVCIFLLSAQASYINGQVITVDGGWLPN